MDRLQPFFYCILLTFISLNQVAGQNLRLGFEANPSVSWLSTNDATIKSLKSSTGLSMAIKMDYEFSTQWSITSGTSLSMNQGGQLKSTLGGNFWVNSDLKLPNLNHGHKPIPDYSTLTYALQYWSIHVGLKRTFTEKKDYRFFINLPQVQLIKLLRSIGAIHNQEELTTGENIYPDLNAVLVGLGTGFGIEKRIGRHISFYTALQFDRTLTDLTKDNGYKSIFVSTGISPEPYDDQYDYHKENSRTSLNNLSIKIGLLF